MSLPSITLRTGSSASNSASKNGSKNNHRTTKTKKAMHNDSDSESGKESDVRTFAEMKKELVVKRPGIGSKANIRTGNKKGFCLKGPKCSKRPRHPERPLAGAAPTGTTVPKRARRVKVKSKQIILDTNDDSDSSDTSNDTRHCIMRQRIIDVRGESIDWGYSGSESNDGAGDGDNAGNNYPSDQSTQDYDPFDNKSEESIEVLRNDDTEYDANDEYDTSDTGYTDDTDDTDDTDVHESHLSEIHRRDRMKKSKKARSSGSKSPKYELADLDDRDIDSELKERARDYITHINGVLDEIMEMSPGSEIKVKADPSYDTYVTIKRNNRFDTYIFSGSHCKNLLRMFISRTADDPDRGYTRIVQLLDNNGFRRFLPINNWKKFWVSYKSDPIKFRALYELILSDRPCKPYLDIEWEPDREDIMEYGSVKNMDLTYFTDKLILDIIEIFSERYEIVLDDSHIMITCSHSDFKVSFHVVVDRVIDGNTLVFRTNLRTQEHSAWDFCYALIRKDDNYFGKIDESVYTTDREFRTVYSNKDMQFRPVAPYHPKMIRLSEKSRIEETTSDCMRYIVTYAKNDEYTFIEVPDEGHNKYSKYREKSSYSSSYVSTSTSTSSGSFNTGYDDIMRFIPQIHDSEEINDILKRLRPIHPTAEFTNSTARNRWRFTYRDRNEPCYTGNTHKSNGFYVFNCEDTGRLYMKCMSERCDGTYTLKRGSNCIKRRIV